MFPSSGRRWWNLDSCFVYCRSDCWRRSLQPAVLQRLSCDWHLFRTVHGQRLEECKRRFVSDVCGWVWTCWL